MSKPPDIWQYLVKVCRVFGLRKYMNFNTEVVGCYWQEESGKWLVKTRQTSAEGTKEQQTECDLVLYATGWLNNWKWPDIEGLKTFKGRVVHTANWPEDYQEKQWANERVAVIGSGASSIQTVPGMQPYVKRMDVYARTVSLHPIEQSSFHGTTIPAMGLYLTVTLGRLVHFHDRQISPELHIHRGGEAGFSKRSSHNHRAPKIP
jgi:cation diffusion facilitator CzcD-associated flavoprotein CzcO